VANSKIIDIHGKIKYIHAVNLNKYGVWSCTLYPDTASLEVLRDLQSQGLKNVMKKDEEGYYMQFKRDPTKQMNGRVIAFTAPKVLDKEGKPFDGMKVGWGSDATLRLEVYPYGGKNGIARGVAARWDAIKILNLIEFNPDKSDWSEDEKADVKSLTAAPEPEPW
jgi:hypothetical protein